MNVLKLLFCLLIESFDGNLNWPVYLCVNSFYYTLYLDQRQNPYVTKCVG